MIPKSGYRFSDKIMLHEKPPGSLTSASAGSASPCRCPPTDPSSARRGAPMLSTVNLFGASFGPSSSQSTGADTGAPAPRARRIGDDRGRAAPVAQIVEEDFSRRGCFWSSSRRSDPAHPPPSPAPSRARSPSSRPTACRWSAPRRAGPCRRWSSRSSSSLIAPSRSRSSRAALFTRGPFHAVARIEIEHDAVACSMSPMVEPQTWISSTPACTSVSKPSRSSM